MNRTRPRRPAPGRRPPTSTKVGRCDTSRKQRFPDFDAAAAAALRVSRKVGPLRCYECPDCRGWHFTRIKIWKEPT